jgi:hypothetical protein
MLTTSAKTTTSFLKAEYDDLLQNFLYALKAPDSKRQ